jgi:cyclic pyranopterin monophosphate synthase
MKPTKDRGKTGDEGLSHLDASGDARMVDVGPKAATARRARASGSVRMKLETRRRIEAGDLPKGSVLGTARIAGIQGAKSASALIPLCHPLPIESVSVDFAWEEVPDSGEARLRIDATASVTAKTGVEMEALTAVAVAALTVYDMAKAVDKGMVIEGIRLVEKTKG